MAGQYSGKLKKQPLKIHTIHTYIFIIRTTSSSHNFTHLQKRREREREREYLIIVSEISLHESIFSVYIHKLAFVVLLPEYQNDSFYSYPDSSHFADTFSQTVHFVLPHKEGRDQIHSKQMTYDIFRVCNS